MKEEINIGDRLYYLDGDSPLYVRIGEVNELINGRGYVQYNVRKCDDKGYDRNTGFEKIGELLSSTTKEGLKIKVSDYLDEKFKDMV